MKNSAIKYILIFLCTFLIILGIVNSFNFPISWDLQFHKVYGKFISFYIESGGKNKTPLSYIDLMFYGGFFDTLNYYFSSSLNFLFKTDYAFEYNNIFIFIFSLIGLVSVYKIGEIMIDYKFGIFCIATLLLIPEYFNHIFMNPKDIPFASLYGFSIYLFILYYKREAILFDKLFYFIPIIIGLSIGIRVLGFILIFIFFTLIFIKLIQFNQIRILLSKKFIFSLIIFGLVAYSSALAFWPYLQKNPIYGILNTIRVMSQFPWNEDVLFLGKFIPAKEIGRVYFPILFIYTFPDYFLFMSVISVLFIFKNRQKKYLNFNFLILLISLIVPLIIIIGMGANLYNGLRQVLFIFIPLTILISYLFWNFLLLLKNIFLKSILIASLLVGFLDVFVHYINFHPYYYVYFNRIIAKSYTNGGNKFDIDYWGLASKEVSIWLKENYKSNKKTVIFTEYNPIQMDYWLNPNGSRLIEKKFENHFKEISSENFFSPESVKIFNSYHKRNFDKNSKFMFTDELNKSDILITSKSISFKEDHSLELIYNIKRNGFTIANIYKTNHFKNK